MIDVEHNTRITSMGGMPAANNGGAVAAATPEGHINRMAELDAESAEAALLRGH
jgi:hypothetical protein